MPHPRNVAVARIAIVIVILLGGLLLISRSSVFQGYPTSSSSSSATREASRGRPVDAVPPVLIDPRIRTLNANLPDHFVLIPTFEQRFPKSRAVFTILPSFPENISANDLDYNTLSVIAQAYTFLQNPSEWLKPELDTEYCVMITERVPSRIRQSLVSLGLRLYIAPAIVFEDSDTVFNLMKLHMWQLEGIYSAIIYLDMHLQFLNISPVPAMWSAVKSVQGLNPNAPFFGATKPWKEGTGLISTGFMVLTPSKKDYIKLLRLARNLKRSDYSDQELIGNYFINTKNLYMQIPSEYNTMYISERTPTEKKAAIGINQIFINPSATSTSEIFKWKTWQSVTLNMRSIQLQIRANAPPGLQRKAPIIPPMGSSDTPFPIWKKLVTSPALYEPLAIMSLGNASDPWVNRQRDLATTNLQAIHFNIDTVPGGEHSELFSVMHRVMLDYEWTLVLDPSARDDGTAESKHLYLMLTDARATGKDIVLFRDCKVEKISVGLLVRQSAMRRFIRFQHEVVIAKKASIGSKELWPLFLEAFKGRVAVLPPFLAVTEGGCSSQTAFPILV
ncbi:hypothetical protein HDU79_010118 [Rhizoclosmatium sp. JEL0117]|nr:hypothetical protein HDU79_010118 [Rhizoclosmatium sp. JEL0117]